MGFEFVFCLLAGYLLIFIAFKSKRNSDRIKNFGKMTQAEVIGIERKAGTKIPRIQFKNESGIWLYKTLNFATNIKRIRKGDTVTIYYLENMDDVEVIVDEKIWRTGGFYLFLFSGLAMMLGSIIYYVIQLKF